MLEHGDDAGHCSNGLSAQNYRGATAEERAIYRKWIRGMIPFYSTLVLIFGVVAIVELRFLFSQLLHGRYTST